MIFTPWIFAFRSGFARIVSQGCSSVWRRHRAWHVQRRRVETVSRVEQLEDRCLLATFMVTNVNDGGAGSLRQAVVDANALSGEDTITFNTALAGQTIPLSSGQMTISGPVTIQGLGASQTIIDGQNNSRLFAITSTAGAVTFDGLTLTKGKTTGSFAFGGAIQSASSSLLTIQNSNLYGNSTTGHGADGGGIRALSPVTITNSNITGNSTSGFNAVGGGIAAAGLVTVTNSTVSGNFTTNAHSHGGGIFAADSTVITNSTVFGNSAAGDFSHGGGINADGSVTLVNSTIAANSTAGVVGFGGAIRGRFSVSTANSTISGNSTSGDSSSGGGIHSEGVVTVTNSTITGNWVAGSGSNGGGIANFGTLTTINNSIVANSPSGGDVAGGFTGSNNLFGSVPLGPLQNNGGPTQTHALLTGSLAIDAGSNALVPAGITTDQRGLPRVVGRVDIGAYEDQTPVTPLGQMLFLQDTVADLVTSGVLTAAQGNSLGVKVAGAIQQYEQVHATPTIKKLESFINEVNALVRSLRLTQPEGQLLIDLASAIVTQITAAV